VNTTDRPIIVLLVGPSLDLVGGQSAQAREIVEGFSADTRVRIRFQPINPLLPAGFRWLQGIKYIRTIVTSIAYLFGLLVKIRGVDIVHVFSASYFSFVLAPTPAIYLARIAGKATIVNYHSGEADDHLTRWPSARRLLASVDRIVVPSAYLVEVFEKFGLSAEVVVNSVDLSKFVYRRREIPAPRFLANRNFEAHYSVATVIDAFREIVSARPEAVLTIAGDGPQRDALQAQVLAHGLKNVSFVGRISGRAVVELYDSHDIWLNASEIDNMPVSILEAFAAGVAVVSTDAGGIPYLVTNETTGLLSPVGREDCLARNAIRLLADPELFQRITAGAHRECARFSWDAASQQWIGVYSSVVQAVRNS
jgi:glycosyltransferase involved in cell wall biosynthesis